MAVSEGTPAPAFDLAGQYGERVRLQDFTGVRPVVVVFFPLAFSSTCTGELAALQQHLGMFAERGAQPLGISVDSKASLRAWAEQEGVEFPLLADFWPHGAVAREYEVFLEDKGYASRTTFVIGADGVIRTSFCAPLGEARPIDAYRAALEALPVVE